MNAEDDGQRRFILIEAGLTAKTGMIEGLHYVNQITAERVRRVIDGTWATGKRNGRSGGFTFFADRVKERLGIDFARSNLLEEADGHLTGRVVPQCWGDICDGAEKRRTLLEVASLLGLPPERTIAVGDGANDLPMMGAAGLSVAFHAKPRVREQAMVAIDSGGLDRLLEVLR